MDHEGHIIVDPIRNPYVPGAGRRPGALVGRDDAIRSWSIALQRAERNITDQPLILYGLRGVGKTVLLTKLRHDAEARSWITVQVEADPDRPLREMLGEGLYAPLTDITHPSAGKRLIKALKTALSFKASYDASGKWDFGIDLKEFPGGGADTGILETDLKKIMKDVALAAAEKQAGLAILIDEAQDLNKDESKTLAVVAQAAAQDNWPVLFAFAGLPSLPQALAEAKSYSERFQYIKVETLDAKAAKTALIQPAEEAGESWDDDAVDYVVKESGRYPYFIQQFGQEAWNTATGSTITLADARAGVATGHNQLDNGFFRARWDRTTTAEKRYLRAMCPEGDTGIGTGEIAARLQKKTNSLGPTRANLLHKGLIYAPGHGVVAFTVPGMSGFITRQPR